MCDGHYLYNLSVHLLVTQRWDKLNKVRISYLHMSDKNLEYYKKINETLMKKMGLAKKHLRDIETELDELKNKRTTITHDKDLEDKDKKSKLSELITYSSSQIQYHINALESHIFNDEHSIKKYIISNTKELRDEKESQLDDALEMDFITADKAEEKRKKWKEAEEKTLEIMGSVDPTDG